MIRIIAGDCRKTLKHLPDESVHMIVASPPYWGLRSYSVGAENGELGLESTPEQYVANMVAVFREARRVLRDDGTVWLNIASSYVSGIIESDYYVLRSDLTDQEYETVTKELARWIGAESKTVSQMQQANASSESPVSSVLVENTQEAEQLPKAILQEVRQGLHGTQDSGKPRSGNLLQSVMCEVGIADAKENESFSGVSDLRQEVQQTQVGGKEESGKTALLQSDMLVQPQSKGQPLPVARGSGRKDESRRQEVACDDSKKGQVSLPDLPYKSKAGSTPHLSVRSVSRETVGTKQRHNSMPKLSHQIQASGTGTCRDPHVYSVDSGRRLEGLTLPKDTIPLYLRNYFRPEYILKPKDDAAIPARLALALQADGWWLRSDIIWSKNNPMPESVRDRPTRAHEYIFLLSKSARYFYDADAIRESAVSPERDREKFNGESAVDTKKRGWGSHCGTYPNGRNKRTVWTVATKPFKESHFATFPPKLIDSCSPRSIL